MADEKGFMQAVIQAATLAKWLVYHTHDSRRSAAGFPDLVLVKNGRLIFAELKADRKAKPTKDQQTWLRSLQTVEANCAGGLVNPIEVHLWTPEDWPEIEKTLLARW